MNTIQEDLAAKRILVADGGWGTLMIDAGLAAGECPELWNIAKPQAVQDIAARYVDAGADIVGTNSFGGSRFKLEAFGLGDRVAELNEAAAALSRAAAGDNVHVIASIGPSGKFLITGEVSEEELYDAFKEQAVAFERGGADACVVETMAAVDEACVAIRAARENTGLEVVCSMVYSSEVDGVFRTMMGASPEDMARPALDAGATILGANCNFGTEQIVRVIAALHEVVPEAPLLANPNAGQPAHTDAGVTYPEGPDYMAGYVPAFIEAGARVIGGCCGSTPDHIRAIRAEVDRALG